MEKAKPSSRGVVVDAPWDQLRVTGEVCYYGPDHLPDLNLPPSYIRFAHEFGYGRLAGLFLIFPPAAHGHDRFSVRSEELQAMLLESEDAALVEHEPDGSPELLRRLTPFGIGENGETLAWDLEERSANDEAPIYLIGSKTLGIWRVGDSLDEFFTFVTSSNLQAILPGYRALPKTFQPLVIS